jgi:hypothetical protein
MHKIPASHENYGECLKFWRKILAENSGGKLWWKILAENFGGKFWRKTLAENFGASQI